jgi:hypothetical protein
MALAQFPVRHEALLVWIEVKTVHLPAVVVMG